MNLNMLVTGAFLLGAAAGALVVSLFYSANLSRVRREFQAELEASVEADLKTRRPPASQPGESKPAPNRVG